MDDKSEAKKENLYARNKIKAMYKYIKFVRKAISLHKMDT
jgi:hypothetical protein